ncbi:MAG TPA: glycosyltransferase family 2 protein, partial [Planctomycetota bacterium]|nr:glycosyltransferase family 2 protein [Planctomycetota bacterium]
MHAAPSTTPEISFVMPCFNEQDVVGYVVPQLCDAFARAGHAFELLAVDNGSSDRTGEILRELATHYPVRVVRVEVNEGYGWGVLCGLKAARTPWIGVIPADGQVDAEDVVRLFEAVRHVKGPVLGKVRRRFRMDGPLRKVVSSAYNVFVWALWPNLGSIDVNGSPKILQRAYLDALDLRSKRWFLDPEMMIKAHYLGVRVLEMNVFARMRGNGLSHVRAGTCWEFFRNLLRFRFGGEIRAWRRARGALGAGDAAGA